MAIKEATKNKDDIIRLPFFFDKNVKLALELDKNLDDLVRSTSSSKEFNEKFGGNIREFNQIVILSALIVAYLEKAAEGDEELKKRLPSLQEKMETVNENIEKIAKELGYTVSYYSLDKLMGKDLNGVNAALEKDFGVELKLEALFSADALNSLTDLFASIVNKYYNNPSSVTVTGATVPTFTQQTVTGATVPTIKEKSAEEKEYKQAVLHQQQAEQSVFKQQPEKQNKENKDRHNPLSGTAKKFAGVGGVFIAGGGVLYAGGFFYLPLAAYGLAGMGLAFFGLSLAAVGGVTWLAGKISEKIHNRHISNEEKRKKEEEKRKKEEEKKKKEEERAKAIHPYW